MNQFDWLITKRKTKPFKALPTNKSYYLWGKFIARLFGPQGG
jgi:hypothetical protein